MSNTGMRTALFMAMSKENTNAATEDIQCGPKRIMKCRSNDDTNAALEDIERTS